MSGRIVFLRALTSLHPGAGAAIGAIDLPIQREPHTGWPMIQGGGVKGVFRDVARAKVKAAQGLLNLEEADNHRDITQVFGPPAGTAGDHAGNLIVSDARILLFPVRSLKGVYAWITCPEVLLRFGEDLKLAGIQATVPDLAGLSDDHCYRGATSDVCFTSNNNEQVVLEDVLLSAQHHQDIDNLENTLGSHVPGVAQRLLVVSGTVFSYFVQFRTEVVTRNAIDYDRKLVKQGALFSEEFLPPQTVMYTVLLGDDAVLTSMTGWIDAQTHMQFGGDATVGKGFCAVKWAKSLSQPQQGGGQNAGNP